MKIHIKYMKYRNIYKFNGMLKRVRNTVLQEVLQIT